MSGRTSYHYVLCWEKNGEVFSDPPACKDYTDKAEAIADAEIVALKIKPGQWMAVFEMEEKWNEETEEWVAEDWTVVHETESGGAQ